MYINAHAALAFLMPEAIRQLPPHMLLAVTLAAAVTAVIAVGSMFAAGIYLYSRACRAMDKDLAEMKVIANREGM